MLAPLQCSCLGDNTKASHPFNIVPILAAIGIDKNTINAYKRRRRADIMSTVELLHPANGVPFSCQIRLENLLGPEFRDAEVGKLIKIVPLSEEDHEEYKEMWGGFEVLDLASDSDEADDGSLQPRDRFRCPACHFETSARGREGQSRLMKHVQKGHPSAAEDLETEIRRRFVDLAPKPSTALDFICNICKKELRGHSYHQKRHAESCEAKARKLKKQKS